MAKGVYVFQRYMDVAGEFRWRLRAPNGKIIAVSGEGYKTSSDRDASIKLVQQAAVLDE